MTREDIVESLVELVLEHEDLSKQADQVARQVSKTVGVDLETIEDTAPHVLYWSAYCEEQARVIGMVQQKLFRYPDRYFK